MALAAPAEHADSFVKGQQTVTVSGLVAQAVCQRGQDLVPPGAQEVILGVCARESGI